MNILDITSIIICTLIVVCLFFVVSIVLIMVPDMFAHIKCEWTGGEWNYLFDICFN